MKKLFRKSMIATAVATLLFAPATLGATQLAYADPASDPSEDPNLRQTVSADEQNATGRYELKSGHVDMGPRMVDGTWKLLIRDDSVAPPQWRDPNEVVLRVNDAAKLTIPDDPNYAFLNLPAGKEVYVIPQTQNINVIWLGWNTQDPAVTKIINRGAKLVLDSITGPGQFNMFLQNGSFDPPQQLFDSRNAMPQEVWADVNTHVHANWVFTEPGVYLAQISAVAKTLDGGDLKATTTVRFAVGDQTSADEAFNAQPGGATAPEATASANATNAPSATASAAASAAPASSEATESSHTTTYIIIAVVAVIVLTGGIFAVTRARATKKKAEKLLAEGRDGANGTAGSTTGSKARG